MLDFMFKTKQKNDVALLREENQKLHKRIQELEALLADYSARYEKQKEYYKTLGTAIERMLGETNDLAARLPGDDTIALVINNTLEGLNTNLTNIVYSMVKTSESTITLDQALGVLKNHNSEQVGLIKDITSANEEFTRQTESISKMGKQLDATAQETATVSVEGRDMLISNLKIFESLEQQFGETASFMKELTESIDIVGRSTALITDLAERLKLLALNASIESARAGDIGKGFGVVAHYMKELSDDTSKSVKEVSSVMDTLSQRNQQMSIALNKSHSLLNKGNELLGSGISKFELITNTINDFKTKTTAIASSLESQFVTAYQITSSSSKALNFSQEVLKLTEEATVSALNLDEVVKEVLGELGSFKLQLHRQALDSLRDARELLPSEPDWNIIQEKIRNLLEKGSCFELLYAMDSQGIQRIDNMVNPKYKNTTSSSGKGNNWSTKDYFKQVLNGNKEYISNIYLSAATGNLCITVSAPLFRADGSLYGVLAGDINLHDSNQIGRV